MMIISCTINIHLAISQDLIWKTNFTGAGNNIGLKSAIDSKNNVYIIGTFNNTCNLPITLTAKGGVDIFITKYDVDGNIQWTRQIGGTSDETPLGIVISPDDEYIYITGIFQQTVYAENSSITSTGSNDGFLVKYKQNGDLVWLKDIASASGNTVQRPAEIKIDKDNHLLIGGTFVSELKLGTSAHDTTLNTNQAVALFFAQLDTSGAVIKAKIFEATSLSSRLYTFDTDASGYYLTGHFKGDLVTDLGTYSSNNASLDMFVYKLDFNLASKWIMKAVGTADDQLYSCSVDNNGYFYVGGHFASNILVVDSLPNGTLSKKTGTNKTTNGKNDIFFAKFKHDGTLQWFNTAGSTENDYLYRALYKNGNFIAAGQYGAQLTFNNKTITPKNTADVFAIVQNQFDNLTYLIPIGGTGNETGETSVVDNNGNFLVIGDYSSSRIYINDKDSLDNSNPGTRDMFVAKFDKASVDSVLVQPTCPGAATGAIYITPTGTLVDPITYAWSKDGDPSFSPTTQNITGLTAGTYRVTFTDNLGYAKSKSFILKDPAPISIVVNSTSDVSCFGGNNGAIDIDVTGGAAPYTYAWTTEGGSGVNAIVQDQITLTAGTYAVQVSDRNGCSTTLTGISIAQPNKITFAGSVVTKINGGQGSVILSVQGGTTPYAYLWTGSGPVVPNNEKDIVGILIAGNYTVNITDDNGCKTDTTFFITNSHVMNAFLSSKQDVLCKGGSTGSITIGTENVDGTPAYTWSPNVGNTATVTNLSAGNYSVTVTDNSTSAVVNIVIAEPASNLSVSLGRTNIICSNANNGILDANAAGGTLPYFYNWTKEGQPYDGGDETQINLSEGTYAVTVTDANNCKASAIQSITNPSIITFNGTVSDVTCEGAKKDGSVTLSNIQGGAGSYTYLWSNGMSSQNITLLAASNYTVTVTDANNCKVSNNFVVGYAAPMTISFNKSNVTCNGAGNGALEAVINGGHTGFSYEWSTGALTQSISNLLPNVPYSVTVTDSKFCTKTATATIAEPAVLSIASVNQSNISCYGVNNGSITLNVTGGTPQYNYSWDQGAGTSATASNLPAGAFNVTVTDANNCTTNGSYTITQPTALGLTEDVNAHVNPLCNGLSTGSITLTPSGGSGEYEFALNNGEWTGNAVYTNLAAGNYSFKLRDKNAITCEFSLAQTIAITQPEAIGIVSTTSLDATQKSPWNGSLNIVVTGGTSPLSFTLDKGGIQQETGSFAGLAPDSYTISITDANNCAPVTSQLITISDATSISMADGSSLKIFPIPATDFINVEYNNIQSTKPLHIVLYSISGKIMYEEKVPAETFMSGYHQINVTNMPKGVYILKVNDAAAKEKVIIQ